MNKTIFKGGGYQAPEIEVVSAVVERGFEGSFGEVGQAGANFGINGYDEEF